MKTKIIFITVISLFLNTAFALDNKHINASFSPKYSQNECVELLKECFAYSAEERNACIRDSSENVFCQGSKLSNLAKKRWHFLASNFATQESKSAFNEPRLTDKSCIENFDNLFSAKLIQGSIDEAEIKKLSSALDSCKVDIETGIELNRQ